MNNITMSKMTGKLTGLQGINTNPLDNPFCNKMSKTETICKYCYSRKIIQTYRKSASTCWSRNGKALSETTINIPAIKADMIRFHAHGELINLKHFINFKRVAFAYPDKTFALWTKRKDIVLDKINGPKPKNMMMVYSNPIIDKPMKHAPRGFDKVFNVVTKEYLEKHPDFKINCGANSCKECQLCYKSKVRIINEVIK